MLEKVKSCVMCKSNLIKQAYKVPDWTAKTNRLFVYSFCGNCGITFLSTRPFKKDIGKYYGEDYQPYKANYVPLVRSFISWRTKREIAEFKKHSPRAKNALEIGASFGAYLNDLKKYAGFSVVGVEMNEQMCAVGRKKFKIPMFAGDVDSMKFSPNSFDIVVMNHVIEHLYQPNKTLKNLNLLLKQDGLLFIKTPNISTIEKNIFGKYWAPFEAPRHTFLFSVVTLKKFLTNNNFTVKKVYFEKTPNNLILSIKNYLGSKKGLKPFSKYFDLNNYALLLLLLPFSIFLGTCRLSGRIVIIAQKN